MTMTMPPAGGLRGRQAALVPVPAAWAAAAKAKLERDRKSYEAFRAVDQQEHERAHKHQHEAAVKFAEDNAGLYRLDVETFEPEAAAALEAARAAEDRARDAREYARTQEAEAARIRDEGSAAEATDAQVRADAADGVAAEREAAAAEARGESDDLERDLRDAREGLEDAERAVRAARKAAEVPAGQAPISDVTVRFNSAYMQTNEVWNELPKRDRSRVHQAGEPRDMMSDEEYQALVRAIFSPEGTAV